MNQSDHALQLPFWKINLQILIQDNCMEKEKIVNLRRRMMTLRTEVTRRWAVDWEKVNDFAFHYPNFSMKIDAQFRS